MRDRRPGERVEVVQINEEDKEVLGHLMGKKGFLKYLDGGIARIEFDSGATHYLFEREFRRVPPLEEKMGRFLKREKR